MANIRDCRWNPPWWRARGSGSRDRHNRMPAVTFLETKTQANHLCAQSCSEGLCWAWGPGSSKHLWPFSSPQLAKMNLLSWAVIHSEAAGVAMKTLTMPVFIWHGRFRCKSSGMLSTSSLQAGRAQVTTVMYVECQWLQNRVLPALPTSVVDVFILLI